jgi:hypothetical protein
VSRPRRCPGHVLAMQSSHWLRPKQNPTTIC